MQISEADEENGEKRRSQSSDNNKVYTDDETPSTLKDITILRSDELGLLEDDDSLLL